MLYFVCLDTKYLYLALSIRCVRCTEVYVVLSSWYVFELHVALISVEVH